MIKPSILKEFQDIETFAQWLKEKINDGDEISRGKDPSDNSKEEKKADASEKPDPTDTADNEDGGGDASPNPNDGVAPEGGAAPGEEEPVVDPVAMPGSQVAMGGIKDKDKKQDEPTPNAVEIKFSGKKNKIDLKPSVDIQDLALR